MRTKRTTTTALTSSRGLFLGLVLLGLSATCDPTSLAGADAHPLAVAETYVATRDPKTPDAVRASIIGREPRTFTTL